MSGGLPTGRRQLESAVRLFCRELGCDPQPSVFLAAEALPAKIDGTSTPARVRACSRQGRRKSPLARWTRRCRCCGPRARRQMAPRTQLWPPPAISRWARRSSAPVPARHQEGEIALQRAINLARESGHRATAAAAYRNLAGSDVLRGIYPRADRRLAEAESLGSGEASEVVEVAAIRRCQPARPWRHRRRDRRLSPRTQRRSRPGALISPDHVDPHRAGLPAGQRLPCGLRVLGPGAADRPDTFLGQRHGGPLAMLGHVAVATGDLEAAHDLLEEALARACQVGDPCWETWAARGLGLHAAASGDLSTTLHYLADAVTRSRPNRGGHLWSHVRAMTDAAPLGRRLGDPRHVAWQEEALATAQRCGMRALTDQLLQYADQT
jgi:hypothetical protein